MLLNVVATFFTVTGTSTCGSSSVGTYQVSRGGIPVVTGAGTREDRERIPLGSPERDGKSTLAVNAGAAIYFPNSVGR